MLEVFAYFDYLNSILVPFSLLPLTIISMFQNVEDMIFLFECLLVLMYSLEISTINILYKDISYEYVFFRYFPGFIFLLANIGKMILSSLILFYYNIDTNRSIYYIIMGQTMLTFLLLIPQIFITSSTREEYLNCKRKMQTVQSNNQYFFPLSN